MATSEQTRGIRKTVYIAVGIAVFFVAGLAYQLMNPPPLSKADLRTKGVYLFDKARILDDFELISQNGESFGKPQLEGKWSLLFFGFTHCPDVCPTTMATLNEFYSLLEKDTQFVDDTQIVMVSVDPDRDTVEKLKPYVEYFNPQFVGLTGDYFAVHRFAEQLNTTFRKVPGGGENYQVDHGANLAIINPYGHFYGFVKPPLDPAQMIYTYSAVRDLFTQQQ